MSELNNYNLSNDDLQKIMSEWENHKKWAEQTLEKVLEINTELENYIKRKIPLSNNSIARLSGFQRANRIMRVYIKILPIYLKEIDSGTVTHPLSSTEIETLHSICNDAKKWQKDYNSAVQQYKSNQQLYQLSLFNPIGTFDITRWL